MKFGGKSEVIAHNSEGVELFLTREGKFNPIRGLKRPSQEPRISFGAIHV
jgi:hypothetical protein